MKPHQFLIYFGLVLVEQREKQGRAEKASYTCLELNWAVHPNPCSIALVHYKVSQFLGLQFNHCPLL